jgi:hypothetical protein
MKRLVAALSLAALSVPAAAGTAYPVGEGPGDAPALKLIGLDNPLGGTPSYNAGDVELALHNADAHTEYLRVAASGSDARPDAPISASSGGTVADESPWSRDHNFIAPPQ